MAQITCPKCGQYFIDRFAFGTFRVQRKMIEHLSLHHSIHDDEAVRMTSQLLNKQATEPESEAVK